MRALVVRLLTAAQVMSGLAILSCHRERLSGRVGSAVCLQSSSHHTQQQIRRWARNDNPKGEPARQSYCTTPPLQSNREDLGRCIIGGGVIGLSLAWRLRRDGASVLIVEKSEPAREATHAAGGMIAHCDPHNPPALAPLIAASARMYPEFVRELREASFESPDLRNAGTIAFFEEDESPEL